MQVMDIGQAEVTRSLDLEIRLQITAFADNYAAKSFFKVKSIFALQNSQINSQNVFCNLAVMCYEPAPITSAAGCYK